MSKKTFYITLLVILIVLGGAGFFFYSYLNTGITPSAGKKSSQTNLFPFSSSNNTSPGTTNTGTSSSSFTASSSSAQNVTIPDLRQISLVPVAGAFVATEGATTSIRYIERGTGHIFEAFTTTLDQTRVSNSTVPRIAEALWLTKDSLILRYLADDEATIHSYAAKILPARQSLDGFFLPDDITTLTALPKTDSVFYLTANGTNSQGVTMKISSGAKVAVFASPFKEWLTQWPQEGSILLTTKPSVESLGFLYRLNQKTGATTKLLGPIRGLTTLANKDLSRILYSKSAGTNFELLIYNVKTGQSDSLILHTLPEKCVWGNATSTVLYCANPTSSPEASYPDDWYKGLVHLSDSIWKYDTLTGDLTQIAKLKNLTNQDIDAINLAIDEKDSELIFMNKNDLTLWSLKLPK